MSAKSSQATTTALSKVSPAQETANKTRAGLGNISGSAKPAESSETSDSSSSEDENLTSVVQVRCMCERALYDIIIMKMLIYTCSRMTRESPDVLERTVQFG